MLSIIFYSYLNNINGSYIDIQIWSSVSVHQIPPRSIGPGERSSGPAGSGDMGPDSRLQAEKVLVVLLDPPVVSSIHKNVETITL